MPRGGPVFRGEIVPFSRPAGIQAAAKVIGGPDSKPINKTGRKTNSDAWQNELWDLYDLVPEFHYACAWISNLISRAHLTIHYKGEPAEDALSKDVLASFFGGPEGQEEMLRQLGLHFTVAGEGYVVGFPGVEEDRWRVVASTEVSGRAGAVRIEGEVAPANTLPIRMWRPHPRRHTEADTPARALIAALRQIVRLEQVVAAQGDSRLTSAGLLILPSEIELPTIPLTTGAEDDEDGEGTTSVQQVDAAESATRLLARVASVAIKDRASAAANVPVIMTAPGEYIDAVKHIEFWSGFDEHVKDLREEVRKVIATGLDVPPEVLTGTADVNHWGMWAVDEAAIKIHAIPLLSIIVQSLTEGYLRPLYAAEGVPDPENYSFEADTSALRTRPNRSKEAFELWDRGAISLRTLLVENGFDPDTDSPSEAEKILWFVQKVASGSTTPDQVAAALERLGVTGIPGSVADDQDTQEARPTRSLEEHPTRDIPDPEETEARGVQASASPVIIDGLVLAAEQMVWRALERAGNRIRTKVGSRVGATAADAYMSVPSLSYSECDDLLLDAWTTLDRFEYPGVNREKLRDALNEYALMLLRSQKPYTRESLARHLLLELSEDEAA